MPDSELPSYTIMIPAYREASVITKLIGNLAQLDYPTDRLEVLILVEGDDEETLGALRTASPPDHFRMVVVPPAEPRTKPKALNFGLTLARGEIVAVYDVEDTPDVLQLRRAAVAMSRFGPEVGCVQAKLSYSNATQNIITKWFTIEYAMWFSFFLPGLSSLGAPIPLGGTSNHFRRSALRDLGGWDPYNVTEDCDLGIRMFRERYDIKVVESTTLEEANSDFVNWVKQRSRWYKGYLQTFLDPSPSSRGAGQRNPNQGGIPPVRLRRWHPDPSRAQSVVLDPHPGVVRRPTRGAEEIFPAPVYYVGLVLWAFGNFLLWYLTVLTARHLRNEGLVLAAVLVPVYWVMMSIAALKAMWQLVVIPSFWEKTTHGLGQDGSDPEADDPDASGAKVLRLVA